MCNYTNSLVLALTKFKQNFNYFNIITTNYTIFIYNCNCYIN